MADHSKALEAHGRGSHLPKKTTCMSARALTSPPPPVTPQAFEDRQFLPAEGRKKGKKEANASTTACACERAFPREAKGLIKQPGRQHQGNDNTVYGNIERPVMWVSLNSISDLGKQLCLLMERKLEEVTKKRYAQIE